jgi:hypothetical protein
VPGPAAPPGRLRVLDVDPDLGQALDEYEFEEARERCTARRLELPARPWGGGWPADEWADCMGLLVVSGGLMRRLELCGRHSIELLGRGDVLQPWNVAHSGDVMTGRARWRVYEPTVVAVLDRRFAQVGARWPEIPAAVVDRLLERTMSLSARLAIAQIPRLAHRLHAVLWHLAGRWGRVEVEGVLLPVQLSHQMLAELVSAQRPSVSHAMAGLARQGVVSRSEDGFWRLHGEPPASSREAAAGAAA